MVEGKLRKPAMALLVLLGGAVGAGAQTPTMGLLLNNPGAFDGYTLFECLGYPVTYLIDIEGRLVHSWQSDHVTANMAYVLEDGNLIRGAQANSPYFSQPGAGGLIQEFDWDGNLLWEFLYVSEGYRHHHDLARLPNGHILLIAWEVKSAAEAIAAGRNPALLPDGEVWAEHIVEIEPVGVTGGTIVWEWHVWDHLIQDFDPGQGNYGTVADHPELVDINFTPNGTRDWLHANAIAYNEAFDQIVISLNRNREFWIIDHSTTTAEAAGHTGGMRGMGGDVLYRWGNPQAYDRGTQTDQKLFFQHDTYWIDAECPGEGHILLFNNGVFRPEGQYSTVEQIETTVDANGDYPVPAPGEPHAPPTAIWTFTATPPEQLYSRAISGAQRLPNGNTLICEGNSGTFWEIDSQDELVWMYVNPVNASGPMMQGDPPTGNSTFRALRFPPDFPGFDGRDLTPGGPIEVYPTTGASIGAGAVKHFVLHPNCPNPFRGTTNIVFSLTQGAAAALSIYDVAGRLVRTLMNEQRPAGHHAAVWNGRSDAGAPVLPGVYFLRLEAGQFRASQKVILLQ